MADWANSYIFMNKNDKTNVLLLPLKGINKNQVTGIISFNIIQNEVIINAFSRKSIEESIKVDCKDYYIAQSFDIFDEKIYGHASTDIQEYYCECKGQNENDIVLTSNPCEWKLIKLCADLDSQTGWQGSRPIYPPIWDHDMDGIMNDRDPDWPYFLAGFGSLSTAQDYIRAQWNYRYGDRWGSYDEFWDTDRDWSDFEYYSDFDFIYFNDAATFDEWFDYLFDWLIDGDHDDIPFWNDPDDNNDGIHDRYDKCPWDDVKPDKNNNNSRNIICDWYYVKDCNGASNGPLFEWWNDFDDMIDVPCEVLDMLSENQAEDAAQMFLDYINSPTTVHPCTGQPLNKEDYMDQICDPDMIEIWSNDQQFLNGSFLTPEVYLVLTYDKIKNWMASKGSDPIAQSIGNQAINGLCNEQPFQFVHYHFFDINNLNYEYIKEVDLSGQDYIYDSQFWQDPNLNFPSQNLPSYQAFFTAFPKWPDGKWMYGADNIYNLVGGAVASIRQQFPLRTENTCALKVSIALNGAGINIPSIPGNSGTVLGEDGKYYFLNAASLTAWMKKTFGEPDDGITHLKLDYNEITSFNVQELLGDKKGIFSVKYEAGNNPSGHVDIYTGERCSAGLDCNIQNNSVEINLWILN